jgi:hypothetical protein
MTERNNEAGMNQGRTQRAVSSGKRWLKLSTGEKVDLLLVAGMALAAEIAVKVFALPRLTSWVGITLIDEKTGSQPTTRDNRAVGLTKSAIESRTRTVDRLYRVWPRKNSCLRRALVLGTRIRAAGPVLMIGVAQEEGSIRAHAWIEVDGTVVGDTSGDYAPLRRRSAEGLG